jgi:hypothetical protein
MIEPHQNSLSPAPMRIQCKRVSGATRPETSNVPKRSPLSAEMMRRATCMVSLDIDRSAPDHKLRHLGLQKDRNRLSDILSDVLCKAIACEIRHADAFSDALKTHRPKRAVQRDNGRCAGKFHCMGIGIFRQSREGYVWHAALDRSRDEPSEFEIGHEF